MTSDSGTHGGLGANPIEFITHSTGDWTLRFLPITLAVTPARRVLGIPSLIRFRRMFGLSAFFYGCVHFLTYVWLDKFFDVQDMLKDIAKQPFITIGFVSLLLMVHGGLDPTLGRRWQRLHRLVYVIAACGVIHYYWLVKSDVRLPVRYRTILVVRQHLTKRYSIAAWGSDSYGHSRLFAPTTLFQGN